MDIKKELNGKRLLILGGSLWKYAIKQFCDTYGVTIVAAGNDPLAGICDIADEYFNVNSTDSKIMKQLIVDNRIDGVYMGGNEPVIAVACEYINELGMSCYCNKKQWNSLQNKSVFKDLCKKFELPVAKSFKPGDVTESDYPVITKPADGSGSNGFSICYNREELKQGFDVAKSFSSTGSVVIEQFVKNDGIVVFYTVSDGKLLFSTIEEKYPVYYEQYGTYVGGLFDFESEFVLEFREKYEAKIQKLIASLNIMEGNFWIEVFHSNEEFFFNEVGFRYGGSGSAFPVDYFRGINQVATDIYYALTGKSRIDGFLPLYGNNVPHGFKYAIYPIYLRTGTVCQIVGIDKLRQDSNILNILEMKKEGSIIPDNGSFGHVVLLIHFIYSDEKELKKVLNNIHSSLRVLDEQKRDMVTCLLDIRNFRLR